MRVKIIGVVFAVIALFGPSTRSSLSGPVVNSYNEQQRKWNWSFFSFNKRTFIPLLITVL